MTFGHKRTQLTSKPSVLTLVCRAARSAAPRETVDFEVLRQVIAAGKLLLADDALVGLDARVGPAVSGELVGPGEPAGIRGEKKM